jgi:hypothetical protein
VTSTGICCPVAITTSDRSKCPPKTQVITKTCASGYTKMPDGSCCNNRYLSADGKTCSTKPVPCAPGQFRDLNGVCGLVPGTSCPPGQTLNREGNCVSSKQPSCPPGQALNREGNCISSTQPSCPPGLARNSEGGCVPPRTTACPPGEVRNARGIASSADPRADRRHQGASFRSGLPSGSYRHASSGRRRLDLRPAAGYGVRRPRSFAE